MQVIDEKQDIPVLPYLLVLTVNELRFRVCSCSLVVCNCFVVSESEPLTALYPVTLSWRE